MPPRKRPSKVPPDTPKHPLNQFQLTPKATPSTPKRHANTIGEQESSNPHFTPPIYLAPTPLTESNISSIPRTPTHKATATATATPTTPSHDLAGSINNPLLISSPATPSTPSESHFDTNSTDGEAGSELSDEDNYDSDSDSNVPTTPCPAGKGRKNNGEDGRAKTPASPHTPKNVRVPKMNWQDLCWAPRREPKLKPNELPLGLGFPPARTPRRERQTWEGFF